MRLFLAIDLDEPARKAVTTWSDALAARLGPVAREIKWVEPANLHLSLHFFGELADGPAAAMRRAMAVPFDTRAFAITLAGGGVFPPTGAIRVIWLGVRDSGDVLQTLYRSVEARLTPLGLQEESTRGFTPHLTIGRVRTPGANTTRALREAMKEMSPPAAVHVLIPYLTLYQSRLSPKGPTYVPIERFSLPG
jgi:2'-5' RNA ligase